jgi:hypothetical protein
MKIPLRKRQHQVQARRYMQHALHTTQARKQMSARVVCLLTVLDCYDDECCWAIGVFVR